MKRYYALRISAFITKLVGWLIIVVGVIVCVSTFKTLTAFNLLSGSIFIYSIGGSLLLGLTLIASGQLLEAVADIATNTARSEHNTARTLEFFDRMSANANRREPTVTAN